MKKLVSILIFYISIQALDQLDAHQPTTLFCHGIIDSKHQINRYRDYVQQPAVSFDFVDAQKPDNWDINTLIFKSAS